MQGFMEHIGHGALSVSYRHSSFLPYLLFPPEKKETSDDRLISVSYDKRQPYLQFLLIELHRCLLFIYFCFFFCL